MSSFLWVVLVALVVLAAAFSGLKPGGTRSVASTRLMTVGTVIFVIIATAVVLAQFGIS